MRTITVGEVVRSHRAVKIAADPSYPVADPLFLSIVGLTYTILRHSIL